MQYYNNILTVEAGWMIEQGIFTSENYRQMAHRGDIQVVRRACRNTPALVAYDSMPDRYKKAIVERVGDPRKQARQNVLEGLIEHSAAATTFFEDYMIDDDRHLPADKRREYYTNAVVLDGVKRLIESRNSKRKALGNRATRCWDEISEAVQELTYGSKYELTQEQFDRLKKHYYSSLTNKQQAMADKEYQHLTTEEKRELKKFLKSISPWPHTLPENPRALERTYKAYIKEGYRALVSGRFTQERKNAAKIATEDQKAMLVTLLADPRNWDNAQVAKLYNMVAEEMNRKPDNEVEWKTVTAAAVAVWRKKCDDLIYAYRRGREQYRANRSMQVKRSAPTRPLLFWSLDGWDVELTEQDSGDVEVFQRGGTDFPVGHIGCGVGVPGRYDMKADGEVGILNVLAVGAPLDFVGELDEDGRCLEGCLLLKELDLTVPEVAMFEHGLWLGLFVVDGEQLSFESEIEVSNHCCAICLSFSSSFLTISSLSSGCSPMNWRRGMVKPLPRPARRPSL